jgi:hypothetical protein
MPAPARRWGRLLVGRAIVAALVALAALPAYLTVAPAWRPAAMRLAGAVVVAAGCVRAARWVQASVATEPPSAFDAPLPPPPAVALDAGFLRLRADVAASTRSRRYFDVILWPRLTALAGRELPRPAKRRLLGRRGPSLRVLEGLVADVERRP